MSDNIDSYCGSEYNYAYTYITAQIAIVGVKISVLYMYILLNSPQYSDKG